MFLSNLNVICKAAVIFPLLLLALEVSHRATSESAPTCQLRSLLKLKVRTNVFVLGANSVPLCESSGHLLLQGTSENGENWIKDKWCVNWGNTFYNFCYLPVHLLIEAFLERSSEHLQTYSWHQNYHQNVTNCVRALSTQFLPFQTCWWIKWQVKYLYHRQHQHDFHYDVIIIIMLNIIVVITF